jgi:site-specific recombinase XerD
MSRSWLSARVGAAMARAGLGDPGKRAHLLHRTFATHLVQQGARLKAVADLLGHASLSTTQVYAKVNLPMLRAVAQPWPGGGAAMKARSLKAAVAFYLESRRRLGFALKSEGALLENLVQHAQQLHHRGPLTSELALNWAQVPPPTNSRQRARRLVAARHFCLFWAAFDPRTQVPSAGLFGPAYGRRGPVHIYTPQEIAALLGAAAQLSPPESLRSRTFNTLLGLLACTGLRISVVSILQFRCSNSPAPGPLSLRPSSSALIASRVASKLDALD